MIGATSKNLNKKHMSNNKEMDVCLEYCYTKLTSLVYLFLGFVSSMCCSSLFKSLYFDLLYKVVICL